MHKALSVLSALNVLGAASLTASLAGIGVSAAGLAVVAQRLDRLGVILIVRLWALFLLTYPQRRQAVECFPTVEPRLLNSA